MTKREGAGVCRVCERELESFVDFAAHYTHHGGIVYEPCKYCSDPQYIGKDPH